MRLNEKPTKKMSKVNLDALIEREDFDAIDESAMASGGIGSTPVKITDLAAEDGFYQVLRKPDFQRETSEWEPQKVCDFIQSFVNNDLIPALILWKNKKGFTYIIDGSHRVSALVAWRNDDYGDGDISIKKFEGVIPPEQKKIAKKTKDLVDDIVGPYKEYKLALTDPSKVRPHIRQLAPRLFGGSIFLATQGVDGDATTAEKSFLKINQSASPINPTELRLIESRKLADGLAARAIRMSGKGHKYWSKFNPEIQTKIELLSGEINTCLFDPPYTYPTEDINALPIGGNSQISLVLEFVNMVNDRNFDIENKGKEKKKRRSKKDKVTIEKIETLPTYDNDGSLTIEYLEKCLKIAQRINSKESFSLGLHPSVYFYSAEGKHKIASFYGTVAFVISLIKDSKLDEFIDVRSSFEHFIIDHDYFTQQIVRDARSAINALPKIAKFFRFLMQEFKSGRTAQNIIDMSIPASEFSELTIPIEKPRAYPKEFSDAVKSKVTRTKQLEAALICEICKGYIDPKTKSFDHIKRKREGGVGSPDNAGLAHKYCNTTYKN